MAIFHDPIEIQGSAMPSLGMLLGTRASSEVFDSINTRGHASFFGADFDNINRDFFNRHVRQMDTMNFNLSRTVDAIMNPDRFRILDDMRSFESIPLCMELSIALFEPVRKGIIEGRMEGFGLNPLFLPEEDFYGRMIDNFTCEDVAAAADEHGNYEVTATMDSEDPDLTDDELYSIRKTREYILNKILAETDRDPTAINLPRG